MIRLIATEDSRNAGDLLSKFEQIRLLPRQGRQRIADAVREGIADNFTAQRAGNGAAWAPLAEMTIIDRLLQGYPGEEPILIRSGDLLGSLIDPGHPDHAEEWSAGEDMQRLEVRSDRQVGEYFLADIHHAGADILVYGRWPAKIPARPIYDLSPVAEERIGDVIASVIDSILT